MSCRKLSYDDRGFRRPARSIPIAADGSTARSASWHSVLPDTSNGGRRSRLAGAADEGQRGTASWPDGGPARLASGRPRAGWVRSDTFWWTGGQYPEWPSGDCGARDPHATLYARMARRLVGRLGEFLQQRVRAGRGGTGCLGGRDAAGAAGSGAFAIGVGPRGGREPVPGAVRGAADQPHRARRRAATGLAGDAVGVCGGSLFRPARGAGLRGRDRSRVLGDVSRRARQRGGAL